MTVTPARHDAHYTILSSIPSEAATGPSTVATDLLAAGLFQPDSHLGHLLRHFVLDHGEAGDGTALLVFSSVPARGKVLRAPQSLPGMQNTIETVV